MKRVSRWNIIDHTCLRRDSIIASFCLIWAKRYSRLLDEGTVNGSSSEEAGDKGLDISGTDVVEETKVDPLYGAHDPVRNRGLSMEKPTLERSEASYPPRRSDVRLPYTFYRRFRSSESRISSEAVQFHVCGYNRSSHELTLFGHDIPAGTLTFSLLQYVHAPGLSKREGNQRSDRRKEGWEGETPAIVKTRKETPAGRGQ